MITRKTTTGTTLSLVGPTCEGCHQRPSFIETENGWLCKPCERSLIARLIEEAREHWRDEAEMRDAPYAPMEERDRDDYSNAPGNSSDFYW